MPLTSYAKKLCLDWLLSGAAATQPVGRWIGMATGTPTEAGDSAQAFPRATLKFAAANSPQGSVTNNTAATCPNTGAAATPSGFNIYDANAAGNRLAWGTFGATLGCRASNTDSVVLNVGSIKVVFD